MVLVWILITYGTCVIQLLITYSFYCFKIEVKKVIEKTVFSKTKFYFFWAKSSSTLCFTLFLRVQGFNTNFYNQNILVRCFMRGFDAMTGYLFDTWMAHKFGWTDVGEAVGFTSFC